MLSSWMPMASDAQVWDNVGIRTRDCIAAEPTRYPHGQSGPFVLLYHSYKTMYQHKYNEE